MDIELAEVACYRCGMVFWLAKTHDKELRCEHTAFYCPQGHRQSYKIKPDETNETEDEPKKKRRKNMIKKALHRITVVWCLYGLVRLCMFVNPLVFRVAKMIKPFWDDNSAYHSIDNELWNVADPYQIVYVWFFVAVTIGVIALILSGINEFSNWFFNTKPEEE